MLTYKKSLYNFKIYRFSGCSRARADAVGICVKESTEMKFFLNFWRFLQFLQDFCNYSMNWNSVLLEPSTS